MAWNSMPVSRYRGIRTRVKKPDIAKYYPLIRLVVHLDRFVEIAEAPFARYLPPVVSEIVVIEYAGIFSGAFAL
jgi:hypothetical protein